MELIFGLILLAYGLSDLLFRFFGLGAYAHASRRTPKIALTFDDGPSERTEALLEVLRRHGVKATFFLTGEKARARPDLVEAIRREGHQIEDHGEWHQAWKLFLPWLEWEHMRRNPGRYYRPPHGLHTPFTRIFAGLLAKRIALWDLESKDWLNLPPEALAERLLYYMRPGSVVLLHDGAERTLDLLNIALPKLLEVGYEPVTLDELDPRPLGPREALIRGLQGFNERYDRTHGLKRVAYGPFDYLKYELKPFPFQPLRGIPALELHMDSERVVELSPFEVLRYTRKGLRELANQLQERKVPTVRVIYGFSYQAESMRVLGFAPFPYPLPPLSLWLAAISTMWQLWLYRGELPRLQRRAPASLMHLTLEDFLRRFPPSTPASPKPAPGEGQTPPP